MTFEDSMDRHLAQATRDLGVHERARAAMVVRRDEALAAFRDEFAEAVRYLRERGVPEGRVCLYSHGRHSTLVRVYPFTALAVGGMFLHEGNLYEGTGKLSGVRSIRHRLRKDDPVVDAGWRELVPCHDRFGFVPDTLYRDKDVAVGDFAVDRSVDGEPWWRNPRTLLVTGTEQVLAQHRAQGR